VLCRAVLFFFFCKRRVGVALHGSSFRSCACLSASLCVYVHLCPSSPSSPALSNEAGNLSLSSSYSTGLRLPALPSHGPPSPSPGTQHITTQHNPAQHPTSTQTSLSLDRPHARHGNEYGHKDEVMNAPLPSLPFLSAPRHDTTRATRCGYSEGRRRVFCCVSFCCVSFCIYARNAS
jgi:hypothetical protein